MRLIFKRVLYLRASCNRENTVGMSYLQVSGDDDGFQKCCVLLNYLLYLPYLSPLFEFYQLHFLISNLKLKWGVGEREKSVIGRSCLRQVSDDDDGFQKCCVLLTLYTTFPYLSSHFARYLLSSSFLHCLGRTQRTNSIRN